MTKKVKNSTDIPFEEHSNFDEDKELVAGADELDNLEPEEIAEILRKNNVVEETPEDKSSETEDEPEKDKKEEEVIDEETLQKELEDKTKDETDDNESDDTDFALPDKLKGKTLEEIAKMYVNVEKLSSEHTDELGELRKQKAELATAKELAKKYEIEMSANKVTPSIKKWTPEEVATFIQKLGQDPQTAFAALINPYIKPLTTSAAQTRNERLEDKLIADNKDKVVPYDMVEINKILKAQPELWKEHGTKAIKVAFNIYKENVFDERMEAKEVEFTEKLKQKQLNKDKEQDIHVLDVTPAGKKKTGGDMRAAIDKIGKMEPDKALAILNKILPRSDEKGRTKI